MSDERYPEDNEKTLHISTELTEMNMEYLMKRIHEKWPGIGLSDLMISAERIQVRCFGFDRYDPGDYYDYIVITKND